MLGALRAATSRATSARAFSTSSARRADLAMLTLIGRLAKDPEVRLTKNEKQYLTYTVATSNYPPPPADPNGERRPSTSTFHKVLCFSESSINYLQNLRKGTLVYVEANFELREPEAGADPASPMGQRQIFLRHDKIRVLVNPKNHTSEHEES
ncbi:hypothetical protein BDQ12DRAFT_171006 [Crucibulum laeve]|uniref:Nucleic acid-binding protein n=1 Tax=Crucibulum laeve TaxID=68775 RepID=A0A5C3MDH9_9AGAR|nr:hypothetical protein BDQ12DRAFT_171006 [Crucibulum laeve]